MAAIIEEARKINGAKRKNEALAGAAPTHKPSFVCWLLRWRIAPGALFENGKLFTRHLQGDQSQLGDRHAHGAPPRLRHESAEAQANGGAVRLGKTIGGLARPHSSQKEFFSLCTLQAICFGSVPPPVARRLSATCRFPCLESSIRQ